MNDEQVRRATVQLANALLEMAADPGMVKSAFGDSVTAEDAVRIQYQMTELRVALPART